MNKVEGCTFCGGEPVYQFQCREIGEGDWGPCDHSRYMYCQKSPEHDTRVVQVGISAGVVDEQAREIERLRLNIAEYNEHERCYQSEIAALKDQPGGVVQWPEADEIMQMAFEEGQPSEDASGYYFELEEFDLFIQRLMEEVASLNSSPVSAGDDFSQFLSAVMDAAGLIRHGRQSKELSEYLGMKCMEYRGVALSAGDHKEKSHD